MDKHLKFFNKKPPPQIPIFQKNIIFFGTPKIISYGHITILGRSVIYL